jgi:L-lactate dehydrogenase complex protein LldG
MNDSRSRILDRIRRGLAINGAYLADQAAAYPPPHPRGPFVATECDAVEQFRAELSGLHAQVHLCDGPADAIEQVCALLHTIGATQAITWDAADLPLPDLLPTLATLGVARVDEHERRQPNRSAPYARLEPVPVCISGVDMAIAESGTMIVASGPGRARMASLLPPTHIALLPAERIVRTLPEAFDRLEQQFGATLFTDRSNLVLITGPSRTADIEQSLTLGVHGPRHVHAFVIR